MEKYKLLKVWMPEVSGNKIVYDPKMGGLRLQYLITNDKGVHQIINFIKPFKKNWNTSRENCTKRNEWGNTMSPMTTVWLSTYKEYKSVKDISDIEFMISLNQVSDCTLIGHLNKTERSFTLGEESKNSNQTNLLTIIKNLFNHGKK